MRTIILTLMFLCSVAACNAPKEPTDHNVLTVSIEPIRYFAESIAGNRFRVTTLVPRGSSPETYEPTPRQLVDLSESKAYLSVGGLGFEQTWMQKLTANIPDLPVINLSKGIEPLRGSHGQGVDPHIWTSPKNAAIMARNLYQVLCQIDSASAPYYRQRFEQLLTRIDSVDQVLHHLLDGAESRTFLIYHPALGYLARDYGLRQLCLEEGGKEPTPARLRSLHRHLAGKTGTTNDNKDSWFIGFSPDLVVGIYIGFDEPRTLGKRETGATAALPIFYDFMQQALKDQPDIPFRIPNGIKLVRVNHNTGKPATPMDKAVIVEALKPDFDFDKQGQRVIGDDSAATSETETPASGYSSDEGGDFQLGGQY